MGNYNKEGWGILKGVLLRGGKRGSILPRFQICITGRRGSTLDFKWPNHFLFLVSLRLWDLEIQDIQQKKLGKSSRFGQEINQVAFN